MYRLETYEFTAGAEWYGSDEGLALWRSNANTPALLDFWRLTASLRYRF